ncbi:MAG TPA: N4-gp56 family major capsid protein [Clostridia bacterium]|nr:N4-gp56 family major capsid protein [Clostridia bacterium]
MAQNYATKYEKQVDEKFTEASFTDVAMNSDYDWNGVQSVVIYDVNTVPMNDYTASGTNRYGSASELGTGTQTMTVGMDRSFTFTIDRKNYNDQQMATEAGKALARQLEQETIPEIDSYRMARLLFSAGGVDGTALTKNNAYEKFLAARASIRNNKAPINGLIAFVSTSFYSLIKQDSSFVKAGDIAQNMLITGQIGRVDNIAIIEVPEIYMYGLEFLITHPVATTKCQKIADYKIHDNPPGISGWLVEGRVNYDAFVRKNKKGVIYAQVKGFKIQAAAGASSTATVVSADVDLAIAEKAGFGVVYKAGATQAAATVGADLSSWTALPASGTATCAATNKIAVALVDADEKCVVPSDSITVVVGE